MSTSPPTVPHERTDALIYGVDPTPRIVAVEPAGPDRMTIIRRTAAGVRTSELDEFRPWLLAQRAEPWAALRSRPAVNALAGDHPLRYLVTFDAWPAFSEATRAGHDAGEVFFRFRSPVEQYLVRSGRTLFKGMVYDDLRRLQLDIETLGVDPKEPDSQVIMVALRMGDRLEEVIALDTSEADLLERLNERLVALDPDVIEGHNIFNFDLPFLAARAARHGVALGWGSDGSAVRIGPGQQRFKAGALSLPFTPAFVHGRHIIDTYQQIQRYDVAGRLGSYGLKNAVEELGLTRPGREFVPAAEIASQWPGGRDRLVRYALDDVRDVDTLSRLAVPTEFYQTQIVPRSFQNVAAGGPGEKINDLMVRAYLAQSHSVPSARQPRPYPGGHAELLAVGAFSPVVKCDVESLYPSIMLAKRITAAADTLDALLPMLADLTARRLHAKAQSRTAIGAERSTWDGLQSSFKVLINSFYGYLGYGRALFNDYDAAERVTLAGREIITTIVRNLEATGATPIEVDTDGVYFVPPPAIRGEAEERDYVQRVGEVLPPGIKLAHDGSYAGMLSLRLKNYALLEHDGNIVLKGSALRSRRLEPCFRAFLRQAVLAFLHDDREAARDAYFDLAAKIRRRELPVTAFTQWGMLNEETLTTQPRLKRLVERSAGAMRAGERVELYEREDGELALAVDYAADESVSYLLRRLHDVAARFRDLFANEAAFTSYFPPLSVRTDLTAAREQEMVEQLGLF